MATIKSFTSLEQSKKLAEILPLESSDMCYVWDYERKCYTPDLFSFIHNQDNEGVEHIDYPCWSLAALLGVLPKGTNISTPKPINALGYCCWNQYDEIYADNSVDACVAMIEKLHKFKML